MTETQTKARPAWIVWVRVGVIIAALGFAVALYGSVSDADAPLVVGRVIMITGAAVAVLAGIWRIAAGKR